MLLLTTSHKVTGGIVLTGKGDFDPVREGLDRQCNIAVTFVSIRTRVHIPDRRVHGRHGSILLQNKRNLSDTVSEGNESKA
jgi:hypothetical protein